MKRNRDMNVEDGGKLEMFVMDCDSIRPTCGKHVTPKLPVSLPPNSPNISHTRRRTLTDIVISRRGSPAPNELFFPFRMRLTCPRWAVSAPSLIERKSLQSAFRRHDRKRRHIIEPSLCNDVLKVLDQSLPGPGSCDVLDINPGAGVWSQVLHERLRPGRHVLVEPQRERVSSFLDPLLNANDSRYIHAYDIEYVLNHRKRFLSFEENTARGGAEENESSDQTARYGPNERLIMTVSAAGHAWGDTNYKGDMAKQFLELYYRSLLSRNYLFDLHKYGLVKLLVWVPETDKHSFVPRTTMGRSKQSVRLEASCDIREIASSYPFDGVTSFLTRWYEANLENANVVAQRQKTQQWRIPPGRKQPYPEAPSVRFEPTMDNIEEMMKLERRPPLIDEIKELGERLSEDSAEWLDGYLHPRGIKGRKFQKMVRHMEGESEKKFVLMMNRLRTTHNRYGRVKSFVDEIVDLEDRSRVLQSMRTASKSREREIKDIDSQLAGAWTFLQTQMKDTRHAVIKAVDDYRAMHSTPPAMVWNRREFEPLLVKRSEFLPELPMTLLELTPKPDFVKSMSSVDRQICFDYVLSIFDWMGGKTVAAALKRIAGSEDAYDDFIRGIPQLFDASQGGWHKLNRIHFRTLPVELIMEIALAYERWSFRDTNERLLDLSSSLSLRSKGHSMI